MNSYITQFEMLWDGKIASGVWFYFYTAFEGKIRAVLNDLKLHSDGLTHYMTEERLI